MNLQMILSGAKKIDKKEIKTKKSNFKINELNNQLKEEKNKNQ